MCAAKKKKKKEKDKGRILNQLLDTLHPNYPPFGVEFFVIFSMERQLSQSHAKVTWLPRGLREVVRSVKQSAPADLSVIHLVEM